MTDDRPPVSPTQEMRFAVVMYGGTSLAIYINGVAQELLSLVRATASDRVAAPDRALYANGELKGAEVAYRKLGQLVAWHETAHELPEDPTIRTRFVIDILSGTSAGGLNAIFLGKALANEQELAPLKTLWRKQADIALLVNDKDSKGDTELKPQKPPQSLLNSRRMYWELLNAFDVMDTRSPPTYSRLVEELDCWITSTDIQGLLLPIDTFDRFVFERRHRKVFQFVYRSEAGVVRRSDFGQPVNPFLAFAGRCTSAFPFAFEPMQLGDIDAVLTAERFRDVYGQLNSRSEGWRKFFEEYLKPGGAITLDAAADEARVEAYRTASFGDGGYLDNKPFTYAIENLALRRQSVPVDRRLFYVEPDPNDRPPISKATAGWREHAPPADLTGHVAERPNALQNIAAALLTLPRVETIREDIELLIERNRDADRLADVWWAVDAALRDNALGPTMPAVDDWRAMAARDWTTERGPQFRAYYRLHFASVLDDLARTVTRAAGFDEGSDEQSAIRCFVQAWADRRYPENGVGSSSQNEFLVRFDVEYRIRRISFMQRRIDELLRFDYDAWARLLQFGMLAETLANQSDWQAEVTRALYELKASLDVTLGRLRADGRTLWARTDQTQNPLLPPLREVGLDGDELFGILDGARSKWESVNRANDLLDERRLTAFDRVADAVSDELEVALTKARTDVEAALSAPQASGTEPPPAAVALNAIRSDFDHYDVYDSIIFPISYGYLGETGRVEVIRISPEDAPSVIDELTDSRRKLAGTAFHHFGGFLDERWRRNDMLWGRLDAAERIVTSVLAGAPDELSEGLVGEAHLGIIADEFTEASRAEISDRLLAMALTTADGETAPVTPEERARLEATVAELQTPEEILAFMKSGYEVDRRLDLDVALKSAGRAAVVTGAILDGISTNPRVGVITKWIARVGRAMWGFAELASPKTPPRLLRYWAWILALAAVLMVGFGIAFNSDPTTHLGWLIILVLAGLSVTTWILRDVFARRARELAAQPRLRPPPPAEPRWKRWVRSPAIWSLAVLVTAVVALSIVEIVLHLKSDIQFWN